MDERLRIISTVLYEALKASADHAFIGEFSLTEPVTIDGEFDLAVAADVIAARLTAEGFFPKAPGNRGPIVF